MIVAASVNGALGRAGLLLTLVAASFGIFSTIWALRAGDRRLLRQAPMYAGLALVGPDVAVVMMERALINRDF